MGIFSRLFGARSEPTPGPFNEGTGHYYVCECQACIDAFMTRYNHEQYTSKGLPIPTWEDMMATQREYNRLAELLGAVPGVGAMEDHKCIVRIMNGEEAEPKASPA